MQGSTALDKFKKKTDLMTLCAANSIQIGKSNTKFEIIEIMLRAVQDCNVIHNAEILHNFITKPADIEHDANMDNTEPQEEQAG